MIYQGIQLLASADPSGVSPSLTILGIVVSIVASLATVATVVIMMRQERNQQSSRNNVARKEQEARMAEYVQFRKDFYGDHRDGMPEVPGVREWMQAISKQVEQVLSEISPNHGSSMKDAVLRVDGRLAKVEAKVRDISSQLGVED